MRSAEVDEELQELHVEVESGAAAALLAEETLKAEIDANFEAGAYTRTLLSSTWAVSETKHTLTPHNIP